MGSPHGHGHGSSSSSSSSGSNNSYDYSFKILLIGDSGVGKSSLLLSFISTTQHQHQPQPHLIHDDHLSPTIGVDFKIKHLIVGGKKLKLTIWDTAGQERFRTLTTSYYRSAQGIILVYDVTRRETFTNLSDVWAKEVELYSTNQDCIKILVGNKADKECERTVSREEGIALAQEYGCLFLECSAKTQANVGKCFEDLALKIMEVPSLLVEGSTIVRRNTLKQKQECQPSQSSGCCS
ncbi:ras-related protein RABC2a-like [Iris pallida]|uniref:Ras-related protein RABC2a-like n=1 Tax=Iris pallida TaxID=29817 RepID=A0AAX6FZQ4_IRIPA|nr:ras-related protein RABC2a-like [Iris pallida]